MDNNNQTAMPSVLASIVEERKTHIPSIQNLIEDVDKSAIKPSEKSLYKALGGTNGKGENHFIMECKSSSPTLGSIRKEYDPAQIATIYAKYADAISVLCEPARFGGSYDHLRAVADTVNIPVLCKDFIIDESQLYAARIFGADAALLMLSVLDDEQYEHLSNVAHQLGLDILCEVSTEEEMERAIRLGARIIGINHRDLNDLSIDLNRSKRLSPLAPDEAVLIAESGIKTHDHVMTIGKYVNGFLVGSSLMSQENIDEACRKLVFGEGK